MLGPTTALLHRHCELLDEIKQRHWPGTSKWNKVEHRLFSAITMNWRGRPLNSHEVVIQSIAATTTRTGLTVHAELDTGAYPIGVGVSDAELNAVPVTGHAFHGEWNGHGAPHPVGPRSSHPEPVLGPALNCDRGALSHPALTGMTRTALTELIETLTADWQTLQKQDPATRRDGGERRRAPGGGRKAKLDLADRVLATVLQQNLALPPTALAQLFAVSKDTIRHTTSEIRRLMDQHGHTPQPPAAHLNTLAGLLVHATTHGSTLTTETKPTC